MSAHAGVFLLLLPLLAVQLYQKLENEYQINETPISKKPFPAWTVAGLTALLVLPLLLFGRSLWEMTVMSFIFLNLSLVFFIDLRYHLIPNRLVLSLAILSLLLRLIDTEPDVWYTPLTGLVAGAGSLVLFALLSRGGIGLGDIKFAAAAGLLFNHQQAFSFLLLACALAFPAAAFLVMTGKKRAGDSIAFGPYLTLSGWLVCLLEFLMPRM